MQVGICLNRYKKNNSYIAYDIQMQDGSVVKFNTPDLKNLLQTKELYVKNLSYAKNGNLSEYYHKDNNCGFIHTIEVKKEIVEKLIPAVVYNEQTHEYRYKVRSAFKKSEKSNTYENFDLFDIQTGKLERYSAQRTLTLAKKYGVEGIAIENGKIVNADWMRTSFFADKSKVKVPYNVFWFFNRIQVELCDIPDQVYALAESEVNKTKFKHNLGLSRADYANQLAEDYARIKQDFQPEAFLAILTKKPCKYTTLYQEFLQYDTHRTHRPAPEKYFEKIRVLSGLPEWAMPLIKDDLYVLSD